LTVESLCAMTRTVLPLIRESMASYIYIALELVN